MNQTHTAPYGAWKSPITSDLIAAGTIRLGQIVLDHGAIYWLEMRPAEGGRYVIVRQTPDGHVTDMTPPPLNARTRVHEYGGGAFTVAQGTIYFSNFSDQRLYRQTNDSEPQPITPEQDMRYADGVVDSRRNRLIYVREDHTASDRDPVNTIVSLDPNVNNGGHILVAGHDFYSSPHISPDGNHLAWLSWDHPNMPWDGTELWGGTFQDDGSLGQIVKIAGGRTESIFQPQWSPDGFLYFISDRTGWWNVYRWQSGRIEAVYPLEAEFGKPHWIFGQSTYGFRSSDQLICAYNTQGTWQLAELTISRRQLLPFEIPYTAIDHVQVAGEHVLFLGGSPTEATSVVRLDLTTKQTEVLRRSTSLEINQGYISEPETLEFPTERGLTAYGFFYAPYNKDYAAPADERPPLLVISHGGPTAATSTTLNFSTQYWTSRGFAVLDVNYGGSTGYGRAYRERLREQWGVVDVDDCINGAHYLVKAGKVDGARLAIRGGSAGGYTTLCALTFRDVFHVGASYFGVSDAMALAQETHKFESRYLDSLIGPLPEHRERYRARSPLYFTERLSCPIIFLQGLDDKIVPPNQAEMMVEALRAKGLPVAYITFEGEQHGFRQAHNIKRALDAELAFYAHIFHFSVADPIDPIPIENL
ncbi:prolyl oligopeptidase family serine peptidase [candidate division KSB3 bacterium]|uniref:Prolyl oligopeptidase family serine peptidase n=1 Tax=candidate division KSB3 bacterium TaxID=2044937 RepID=A0A9D5K0B1_9BACT|nr:prolyl oligopeptidase family serine peptidase [candidate division KSB3 bacterium]MBD3327423.1 prolyl oligopeptidase family serine peptidase [candidate division KSB3 bacterium]